MYIVFKRALIKKKTLGDYDSENTDEFCEIIHRLTKVKLIGTSRQIYIGFPVTPRIFCI